MTTGIEYLKPEKKKRGRGPGKKPTFVNTSLRLPREVIEYFETFPNKQAKIREVLVNYVETQTGEFENGNS
jgi:uncharacterized protein (DUF4415 family)